MRGVKNHPLSGITLPQWFRLLREHGSGVEWLRHAPRLVFLTLMACLNTIGAACDTLFYGRAIATQELNDEPVFILGHPRTGTTHLHNLLSKDPRFAHATTFSVGFPSGFLCMRRLAPYLGLIMDAKRPMDNMALAWNTPQEDEIAVNQLSAGASPYMPLCFPRREASFRKFYDFRDADEADLTRWKDAFMYFLKKTQFAAGLAQAVTAQVSRAHRPGSNPARDVSQGAVRVHPQAPPRGVSVRRAHGGRVLLAVSSPETDVTGHAGVHSASGRAVARGVHA